MFLILDLQNLDAGLTLNLWHGTNHRSVTLQYQARWVRVNNRKTSICKLICDANVPEDKYSTFSNSIEGDIHVCPLKVIQTGK